MVAAIGLIGLAMFSASWCYFHFTPEFVPEPVVEPSVWQMLGEYIDLEPLDLHNITLANIIAVTQDSRWQHVAWDTARFFMGKSVIGEQFQAHMPFVAPIFSGMLATPGAKASSAMWPFRVEPTVGANVNSQLMAVSDASR